jgi:RimJ/RimL family protein N-acetyltransferase
MAVELKIPTWQDMDTIRKLWSDEETMRPVGGPVHLTDDQALEWFQRVIDPGGQRDHYRLIINEKQRLLGEVSCHQFDPRSGSAMFNLKVLSSERGKGYARAAMQSFLTTFFNELGGSIMLDDIALENLRGQDVLLQFGFVHDPSHKQFYRVYLTKEHFNHSCTWQFS